MTSIITLNWTKKINDAQNTKSYLIWKMNISEEEVFLTEEYIGRRLSRTIMFQGNLFAASWSEITKSLIQRLKCANIKRVIIIWEKTNWLDPNKVEQANQLIDAVKNMIPTILKTCSQSSSMDTIRTVFIEEVKIVNHSDIYPTRIPEGILKLLPVILTRISKEIITYSSLLYALTTDRIRFRHSIETMLISMWVASNSWIFGHELVQIWISALMHDIWFSCIPQHLKEKKGIYTETERYIVRIHSIIWYLLLSKDDTELSPYSIIAGIHHESSERYEIESKNWYGIHTNFAYRLKQPIRIWQDVKNCADIVSVSDRFTALRSERAYRDWFSLSKTLSELIIDVNIKKISYTYVRSLIDMISKGNNWIIFIPGDEIIISSTSIDRKFLMDKYGYDFWNDKLFTNKAAFRAKVIENDEYNPLLVRCFILIPLKGGYAKEDLWIDLNLKKEIIT